MSGLFDVQCSYALLRMYVLHMHTLLNKCGHAVQYDIANTSFFTKVTTATTTTATTTTTTTTTTTWLLNEVVIIYEYVSADLRLLYEAHTE